jgi:hypothetical protein
MNFFLGRTGMSLNLVVRLMVADKPAEADLL